MSSDTVRFMQFRLNGGNPNTLLQQAIEGRKQEINEWVAATAPMLLTEKNAFEQTTSSLVNHTISTAKATQPDLSALFEAQQHVNTLKQTSESLNNAVELEGKTVADHKEKVVSLTQTISEMQNAIRKFPDPLIFSQVQSYGDSLSQHVLHTLPNQQQLAQEKYNSFQRSQQPGHNRLDLPKLKEEHE